MQDELAPKKQRMRVTTDAPSRSVTGGAPKPKGLPARPVNTQLDAKSVAVSIANPDVRSLSVQPILAPSFQSKGWEGEIQELLVQITPTSAVEKTVNELVRVMAHTVKKVIPEAELSGFAGGNLTCGKAFGVAVPEVDIIATASPQLLFQYLHGRSKEGSTADVDAKKLQKCAIRTLTDRLVSAGFKFRRSAFRSNEPKVTILAPASLGIFSESIPIDFSVNIVTPFYNQAILSECGSMDSRTKELILIVKRWAKDRGICHAAKGHLSPYLWGLLTVYFLQVGAGEEGALLPPLDQFAMYAGICQGQQDNANRSDRPKINAVRTADAKTAGNLFKEFVHFFSKEFAWCNEVVSTRTGQRSAVSNNSLTSQVGPTIEDPFQSSQNLGDGMNDASVARLKEELSRAEELCQRDASLSEVLEPWVPKEVETAELDNDEVHSNGGEQKQTATLPCKLVCKSEQKQAATLPCKLACKKLPGAGTKSVDWRRDAAEAKPQTVTPSSTPPWRRTGAMSAAKASVAA